MKSLLQKYVTSSDCASGSCVVIGQQLSARSRKGHASYHNVEMHALSVIVNMSLILPYQFEPESDPENIDEEDRLEPVQARLLQDVSQCSTSTHYPATMSSPRRRRRRDSMEYPPNMLSDVIHLQEEFKRLHEDIFPEFNKHLDKISDLINEFENGLSLAVFVLGGAVIAGGIGVVFAALSFILYNEEVSDMFAGSGAAVAVVAALCTAFWIYKTTQQRKNLKRTIEEERKRFQDKINLIIDMLEKNCQRTEEILRDLSLSEHKAQVLSEHLASCFRKTQLFQEHDSKVGDRMSKVGLLSGNLSEMIAKAPSVLGEDPSSIEAHVNVLHSQHQKMQPDFRIVRDRMQQTFAWRQKEIADGMTVEDTVKKYPFLRTPTGLCDELERIRPATGSLCRRFTEVFKCTQRKCPLFQIYLETKEEALTEDLPDIDLRAALIFLPYIFKENTDRFITLGEVCLAC
ncbi:unnamed protein product [Leuciscus chuanchicus]